MCSLSFVLVPLADPFRLTGLLILFLCWYSLRQIVISKRKWDTLFWVLFSLFLLSLVIYEYLMSHVYAKNIFSYNVIIYCAAIIVICGLLLSRNRSLKFENSIKSKRAIFLFVPFFIFGLLYLLTLDFNFDCSATPYWVFIILLQVIVYPMLLLFGILAFLCRLSACFTAFIAAMALFLVECALFVVDAIINTASYGELLMRLVFCLIYFVYAGMSIFILNQCRIFVTKT
ncbi:hypothetical protein [Francisella sp. 19X1-34]|uniref:hypothetical protein n=1 Tax=Francisella sp. 19X1-34 TaxID=3087177 RepID=UPI002E33BD13|nr:hypothetical protein [Francisella sp. 19X1-34]MED7788084.1 hypothetical protein [Francisella sp. 19X1-34]